MSEMPLPGYDAWKLASPADEDDLVAEAEERAAYEADRADSLNDDPDYEPYYGDDWS